MSEGPDSNVFNYCVATIGCMKDVQQILAGEQDTPASSGVEHPLKTSSDTTATATRRPVGFDEVQYNLKKQSHTGNTVLAASGTVSGGAGSVMGLEGMVVGAVAGMCTTKAYQIYRSSDVPDGLLPGDFYLLEEDQIDPFDGDMAQDELEQLWQESNLAGVSTYRNTGRSRLRQFLSPIGGEPPEKVTDTPDHASAEKLIDEYRTDVKPEDYQAIIGVDTDEFGEYTVELWVNWHEGVDMYQPFLAVAGDAGDNTVYPAFGEYDEDQKLVNK